MRREEWRHCFRCNGDGYTWVTVVEKVRCVRCGGLGTLKSRDPHFPIGVEPCGCFGGYERVSTLKRRPCEACGGRLSY